MKKCPYCAEEIQDEAIVCRYCGRDLIPHAQPIQIDSTPIRATPKDPPVILSLLLAILVIIFVDFLSTLYLIQLLQGGQLYYALTVFNLAFRLLIGVVSVYGYKPIGAKPIHYVGMILLTFIPIGSWFSIYYFGKALARKVPSWFIVLAIIVVIGLGILLFSTLNNSFSSTIQPTLFQPTELPQAKTTNLAPTLTSSASVTPTSNYSQTQQAIVQSNSPEQNLRNQGCIDWRELDMNHIGKKICVYGIVATFNADHDSKRRQIVFEEGNRSLVVSQVMGFKSYSEKQGYEDAIAKGTPVVENEYASVFGQPAIKNQCIGVLGTIAEKGKVWAQWNSDTDIVTVTPGIVNFYIEVESPEYLFYCKK